MRDHTVTVDRSTSPSTLTFAANFKDSPDVRIGKSDTGEIAADRFLDQSVVLDFLIPAEVNELLAIIGNVRQIVGLDRWQLDLI